MSTNKLTLRIITRNDTAANWLQNNPILLKGEMGIEIDTNKIKVGDGVTPWSSLSYITGGGGFNPANAALLENITQDKIDSWDSAQANVIEKITLNGVEQQITAKTVDITAASLDHNHDDTYVKLTDKGVAGGVATLGEDGLIPSSQLPSYVDDVIEADTFDSLPTTGENGKVYVTKDDNKTYRWSGTQYTIIGNDLSLGETQSTAFRGDYGKIAYDHSQSAHAPANAQENIIEIFKIAGKTVDIVDKTVDIPIASSSAAGAVKSSNGANKVNVDKYGNMGVGVISTSTLKVPIGEFLIMDGGTSSSELPTYPTRINNIGYDTIKEAVSASVSGDTITLADDVNLGTKDSDHLVVKSKDITLDLAGKSVTANGSQGAIYAKGGTLTLKGTGTVEGTLGSDDFSMAVWAENGNIIIRNGTYKNATDGSERGTDLIYASGNSIIEIRGGIFEAAKPEWTLNCKDADYKAGIAKIIVKGGKFKNFDPANNNAEGPGTNFLAEGYKSELVGEYYVVSAIQ